MPLYVKHERILIIESDDSFGEKLKQALFDDGYDVKLVKDGNDGLKAVYDSIPHLMIIDAGLTGMDGYELLQKKQAEPLLAKIPVFMVSIGVEPIDMHRIPENSVSEFFWTLNLDAKKVVEKVNQKFHNSPAETAGADKFVSKKLLWVEDDKLIGTILSKKLTSSGFDLFHAKNGEEAMEILRSVIPDVIVLDLVLPNMSGFDILQAIKSDSSINKVPVMILSNLSKPSDIERAKALGALKFLVKAATSLDQIVDEIRSLSK